MNSKPIIMFDSPEGAQKKSVEGWYDRFGHFFGEDERTARWSGCTHIRCPECGAITEKGRTKCDACYQKQRIALFESFPVEKWDGKTPLVLFDDDKHFFDDEILDYMADSDPAEDENLRICKCEPVYLHLVNSDDWVDDLPEDGELPNEVQAAVDALNEKIGAAGPVAWREDEIRIDVADLRGLVQFSGRIHD